MEKLIAAPPAGAIVEARGARWRLVERRMFERCTLVTLRGQDQHNFGDTLRLLTPFDRLAAASRRSRLRLAGGRAVAWRVAGAVTRAHPWNSCWTAATARMDLLSWQVEPTLAVLGGATRVLLADEVGLGKTVQAGLILAELSARGLIDRTLILTPAGLRAQWADELAARFDISAQVLDQAALAREAAQLPPGANPWSTAAVVISSIDLVKRADTLTAVDRVPFDLLIVDEAHHLTPGSDRGALIARLAQRTPWLLLVSATPHSGDARAFAFLRDLGATSADRLTIFRRSAPPRALPQRVRLVRVRTTPDERVLLAELQDYARAIWAARGATSAAARLVAIVLARRAASSAEALLASLGRRRTLLANGGNHAESAVTGRQGAGPADMAATTPDQPLLPWEESDADDGDEADGVLATLGLSSVDLELRRLDRLMALARHARAAASKPAWIARLLARTREPLIVFSEYRDTVEALRARFESVAPVAILHGGLSPSARRIATTSFVDGHARLLLATDAGGEGLNLQARCRAVVDVELPWNPLRLAQRVGRVDRLGQQRRVHAMHLFHEGSVEETVLAHLYRRQAQVDSGLESLDTERHTPADLEARVAAAVLSDAPASLSLPAWLSDSAPGAEIEVRRLERLRRLGQSMRAGEPRESLGEPLAAAGDEVPVSIPRRSDVVMGRPMPGGSEATATATCVFEAAWLDAAHRPIGAAVVPVSVTLSRRLGRHAVRRCRACLRMLEAIAEHVATSDPVAAVVAARLQHDRSARIAFGHAVRARIEALVEHLRAGGDRWHQPALFDDRSSRAAGERASVRETHRAHLEHLASTLVPTPPSTNTQSAVVANDDEVPSADVPAEVRRAPLLGVPSHDSTPEPARLIGVWLHD